ncbi:MAG: 30S ribosomal protein S24e [Desulfurococcales archaeon]|nr:30S ribosomal protein S24e [Desulfurococcales archaeon]
MSQTQSTGRVIDLGEGVTAEVVEDKYNPLIKRREIKLRINHMLKPTPMRVMLRMALAEAFGVDIPRIYIRSIRTEYGMGVSWAEVHIYDTKERALQFEPKYIIERNGGVELELG